MHILAVLYSWHVCTGIEASPIMPKARLLSYRQNGNSYLETREVSGLSSLTFAARRLKTRWD